MLVLLLNTNQVKIVSDVIKGLGVLQVPGGNLLVELNTLRGRGVAAVDWDLEMSKRLKPHEHRGMLCPFSKEEVEAAVSKVISEELPTGIVFPDIERAHTYRFATTKGGSHSSVGSVIASKYCDELPGGELTRRNFIEALHSNPLLRTPPGAWVSKSEKLEHGKSRALFACDTMNYLHFDAPCREIERNWRGLRVNLNPAAEGQGCDYERRVACLGRYKLMFDFKDFNSAHTLESQQCVIRHLFKDLDTEWRSWLEKSITNMWIRGDEDMWFRTMGTLMSGHRMTSIINSVLNAAYTRIAIGERLYNSMYFEHVGDDILGSSEDCDVVDLAVRRMLRSGLALQRAKQGCGTHSAEFLRVCFNETAGIGYAARCIAGIVSGNWVSENQLSPRDYTTSLFNGLWNIITRCAVGRDIGLAAYSTVVRRIGLQGSAAILYTQL